MNLLKEYIKLVLKESPIRDFETIGRSLEDKGGGSFNSQDKKLLSNPKAIQKIRRQWEKTEYTFDIYLLNVPQLNKSELREVGEVSDSFAKIFEETTGQPLPNDPSAITILFNGNYGAEKVPMTGWIMAHRFGHAVRRNSSQWQEYVNSMLVLTRDYISNVYEKTLRLISGSYDRNLNIDFKQEKMWALIFSQIGSFKSARDGKINRYYEFFYEIFAQYLITGSVEFRPLTKEIAIEKLPFGNKRMARAVDDELLGMWNRDMYIYSSDIESRIINILENCVGKTFLM
jgi:hypothetical protein